MAEFQNYTGTRQFLHWIVKVVILHVMVHKQSSTYFLNLESHVFLPLLRPFRKLPPCPVCTHFSGASHYQNVLLEVLYSISQATYLYMKCYMYLKACLRLPSSLPLNLFQCIHTTVSCMNSEGICGTHKFIQLWLYWQELPCCVRGGQLDIIGGQFGWGEVEGFGIRLELCHALWPTVIPLFLRNIKVTFAVLI